ncbi:MAG TPA: LysM peptidoglycan-binding domain-containing protein [Candidatus Binatia bacterium]|nr:LysM peptidoglycan-binding domain-containing protein [Candidatus Binatia bacterium]
MHRPRLLLLSGTIAAAVASGPILGAVAMASDPTVVVRPGDTLTGLSKRHNVSIRELVDLNGLADPNRIYAGQHLRIATPAAATPAPAPAPAAAPATATVHVVRRGENLTTIARHYGVSVAAIVAANAIANPSRIFGGQRLTIPGSAPAAATPAPAPAPGMPASMAALVASRDAVRQVIVEEAARYGVPASFALAVAWQESGWRQNVVSRAGAIGVMQLLPATAAWVGETMLGAPVNPHDTRENVRAGVRLLAHYLARYAGNRDLVLAAYYQGQTAADRHGVYPVSRSYVASINAISRLFGG